MEFLYSKRIMNNNSEFKKINKKDKCSFCKKNGNLYYRKHSGQYLCSECLIMSIERIIYRTISKYKMLKPEDKIIVALSGGKDSITLLYNLIQIQKKTYKSKSLVALSIDEGIQSYTQRNLKIASEFCEKYNIEHKIISFKTRIGKTLDEIIELKRTRDDFKYRCNYYSILRNRLLNDEAKQLGGTVLVLGTNLTDISETFLMNILNNKFHLIGDQYGLDDNKKIYNYYIKKVMPLMKIPQNEILYYAKLKNLKYINVHCLYRKQYPILRKKILEFIENLKIKSPEIEFNLFNGFIELLKVFNKEEKQKKLNFCIKCNYPTNNPQNCNYCNILEDIY